MHMLLLYILLLIVVTCYYSWAGPGPVTAGPFVRGAGGQSADGLSEGPAHGAAGLVPGSWIITSSSPPRAKFQEGPVLDCF